MGFIAEINLIYILIAVVLLSDRFSWMKKLYGNIALEGAMLLFLFFCIVAGFVPAFSHTAAFKAVLCLLMVEVGLTSVRSVVELKTWRRIPSAAAHIGTFLFISACVCGSGNFQRMTIELPYDRPVSIGLGDDGKMAELPYLLNLKNFEIEMDPSHGDHPEKPIVRQYVSDFTLLDSDGLEWSLRTKVNHPAYHKGWFFYQSGYTLGESRELTKSVFLCVRDPWAPVKETALWIMLVSAIMMAVFSGRSGRPWLYAAALAALTAVFAVFKLVVYGTPEVPVLRSFWFVPHIVAYVAAFVILSSALVLYIIRDDASRTLVRVGWGFLTLGMVIGSIWAKRAWGDYWGWDPKETWAAATWISYLLFLHIPEKNRKLSIVILFFSLLLLCMSWWGVNLLPSAKMSSMHVY